MTEPTAKHGTKVGSDKRDQQEKVTAVTVAEWRLVTREGEDACFGKQVKIVKDGPVGKRERGRMQQQFCVRAEAWACGDRKREQ